MLKVQLTIYDGCSWNHSELTLYFKDYAEIEKYKQRAAAAMDDVKINSIEEVNENENK